jgi:hypothetical protein
MAMRPALAGLAAAWVWLAACGGPDEPVCSSGRIAGTSEGEDMAPGQACLACHAYVNAGGDGMEAPSFGFAGTVYETGHEPDGCVGGPVDGAAAAADGTADRGQIEVTAATGERFVAPVTAGGNFMLDAAIARPFTARIVYHGRSREMVGRQASGDCNACHTADGATGAPGRIRLP